MFYNLGTKTLEPTRSVKLTLNIKAVPIEICINFLENLRFNHVSQNQSVVIVANDLVILLQRAWQQQKMQHVQCSSHSGVSSKSSEFISCDSEMCKLWRGVFSKQQQMSSFTQENVNQNEQCNTEVTHCCQQITTTISYIGRIPYNTDQRQRVENSYR